MMHTIASGRTRTCDLRVRSPALYPTELRTQNQKPELLTLPDLGVGDGSRTHNFQIHSLVLCQLNYTHHAEANMYKES